MRKKIVLTGGGTVGHVTLNLLLIPKLIKDGFEVHYIGDQSGIEYQEIKRLGEKVTFHAIATGKLRRYFSWQNLLDMFKVIFGVFQSLAIIANIKPQALFSKGGFVSVPPVIAARLLGVPVFVHESDLSMGLANKIAYRFATKMYTTFEQTPQLTKTEHIGAITKIDSCSDSNKDVIADIKRHFDDKKKTLLFIGGSAGARVFNDFISKHIKSLCKIYNIINISGDSGLNTLEDNLYRIDYVTDLYQPLLSLADVVITRGGSNTLFELLALKKLQIIVPLGKEASRGDQLENAAYFKERGYALQLDEQDLDLEHLTQAVEELMARASVFELAMAQSQELTSLQAFYQELMASIESTKG